MKKFKSKKKKAEYKNYTHELYTEFREEFIEMVNLTDLRSKLRLRSNIKITPSEFDYYEGDHEKFIYNKLQEVFPWI